MSNRWGRCRETVSDFIFLGSKINANGDYGYKIKRYLLLGKIAMTNLDSVLKSRDITLPIAIHQSYGFSSDHLWMWELDHKEGWVLKNWYFQLWSWRGLLRVPWIARRSNHSILKETSPEYSLEGLMGKCQYFAHLMRGGQEEKGERQRMRCLVGITDSMDMSRR